jgi:hypothetical protein
MPREDLIQVRRGTAAEWTSVNPTLADGEFGLDETNDILKIGDGFAAWDDLPSVSSPLVAINTQTGTSYEALQSDHDKLIQVNNGGAHTLTLPVLAAGTVITVHCEGAGGVTFAADGTTFDGSTPNVACAQNEGMQAIYTSTTTIAVLGGTA